MFPDEQMDAVEGADLGPRTRLCEQFLQLWKKWKQDWKNMRHNEEEEEKHG